MGLRCVQLQLFKRLSDRVEASGMERLDDDRSPHQLSFCRDDKVQVPKVHVRARDPANAVTSHPRPDVDVQTCEMLLPDAPTIDVLSYQLVNF